MDFKSADVSTKRNIPVQSRPWQLHVIAFLVRPYYQKQASPACGHCHPQTLEIGYGHPIHHIGRLPYERKSK